MTKVLDPLYIAVAWVIMRIHSVLSLFLASGSGLTWVLTIVVLVIIMRLVILPLFVKQMHATRKMAALAPQMQELRKKYKNDRQTLNEETMKLYRENGVNPLGGCLPLVAQLPLFFALFGVLRAISGWKLHNPALHGHSDPLQYGLTKSVILSAQHANIFGATISDKFLFALPGESVQAKVVIVLAVLVSVVTTYLTVRQSTKRGMTPQMPSDSPMAASQKYMTYIVPFFALSGLYWAFGLVLYWMTTNIWTLGQQYVLFKRFPQLTAAGAAPSGGSAPPATGKRPPPGSSPPARPAAPQRRRGTPGPAKPAGGQAGPSGARGSTPAGTPAAQGTSAAGQARPGGERPSPAAARGGDGASATGRAQGKPATGQAGPAPGPRPAAQPKPAGQATPASQAGSAAAQGKPPAAQGKPRGSQARPGAGRPAPAGQQPAAGNGSGFLRRLGRGRPEPEPEPQAREVKIVRQQPARQSRSKRSGKR